MSRYAASTSVTSSKSRDEIERTLQRYGATAFAYATAEDRAMVEFVANGRRIRFVIPMPDRRAKEFTLTPTGRARSETAATEAWEQATRQSWRALALLVKAQLEAVAGGIVTFEDAFLPHTVLPSGRTVAQEIAPQVEAAYLGGSVPLQIGPASGPQTPPIPKEAGK